MDSVRQRPDKKIDIVFQLIGDFLIKIRAHHLLCIQGFQGYGYSLGFAEELGRIKERLYSEDPVIEIVEGMDDICHHCPNRLNELCKEHLNKVIEMDRLVLEILGIPEGITMRFLAAIDAVDRSFDDKFKVDKVCGGCRWKNVCLFYQSRS
jgi:hypothetical protein